MNEVIKCILERRSIRKYQSKQITEENLQTLLEAGLYAPSAGGRQGVLLLVTQDEKINDTLGRINKAAFKGRISTETNYVSKDQPSIADDVTIQSGFYGAPTVITLFGENGFIYKESDCAVAAENIQLAAHSIGLASCMIGRACDTFANSYGMELLKTWQITENYIPICHVLVGYPDCEHPKAKVRGENRVILVQKEMVLEYEKNREE